LRAVADNASADRASRLRSGTDTAVDSITRPLTGQGRIRGAASPPAKWSPLGRADHENRPTQASKTDDTGATDNPDRGRGRSLARRSRHPAPLGDPAPTDRPERARDQRRRWFPLAEAKQAPPRPSAPLQVRRDRRHETVMRGKQD